MLKATPQGDQPITDPEVDESDENKGEAKGGYIQNEEQMWCYYNVEWYKIR